jgi:hypothetical protein
MVCRLVSQPAIKLFTRVYPKLSTGARTASHYVQLYRYFVSQSSEFCCHKPFVLFLNECLLLLFISSSAQSGNFWLHPRSYSLIFFCHDRWTARGGKYDKCNAGKLPLKKALERSITDQVAH